MPLSSIIVSAGVGIVVAWAIARHVHLRGLHQRARQRLNASPEAQQVLSRYLDQALGLPLTPAELGAYGALTAAEFVWSWASIDPDLLHAADFASTDSVTSGLSFAEYIHHHFDGLSAAAKEGFATRLSGYVAEQKVAALLEHAGHAVRVAEVANQPVWDLVVDGHLANVKDVAHTADIWHEALMHPNVDYYVPTDAHGAMLPNIHHLSGFEHGAAKEALKDGIASAHGEAAAHALTMHIPFITIGFAAYRNYRLVKLYGQGVGTAIKHGAIESVGRGSGVIAGAKGGAALGSLLGPWGVLAGGLAGGVAGALAGGAIAELWKSRPLKRSLREFQETLAGFGRSFRDQLPALREHISAPLRRMQQAQKTLQDTVAARQQSWRWRLWPDFYTVLLNEAAEASDDAIANERERSEALLGILRQAETQCRWEPLGLLMVNAPAVRERVGHDLKLLAGVLEARKTVFTERKRLNPAFSPPPA